MARYCTKCGKELVDGKKCTCSGSQGTFADIKEKASSLLVCLMRRMGVGTPAENSESIFETGQQIVPDIIKANEGEIPVKQYDATYMRSRIRGQYAKGRLQVTNKRVIFRAAGISYQGPLAQQYEFAISELAGIEIKKKNRVSGLNILLSLWLNLVFVTLGFALFAELASNAPTVARIISVVFAVACAAPFFVLRKRFWLKMLALCCGMGALTITAGITKLGLSTLYFGIQTNIADLLLIVMALLWVLNVILVSVVPDLVLVVKTKGSGPAFEIRRKQFPSLFKQMVEYTDFGEVLPGKDVDAMIAELGTLIDDIQTLGDMAIEKWKEN